jgi:DNA invertase Pin-like site-specific DNA recombinase
MTKLSKAVCYARVSGIGQVEKTGLERQEESVMSFADKNDFQIVSFYKEAGISGTTNEGDRPAFKEMIGFLIREQVQYVIIEAMDRLARELRVQENLCVYLASKDIQLISANTGENITKAIEDDPMKKAMIQIQGVFAELDKSQIVKKLKNGRDKVRIKNEKAKTHLTLEGQGKCEGRKSYAELNPDLIRLAKKMYRKPRNGKRLSLRQISSQLYDAGHSTKSGNQFSASQIKNLLTQMS